jgi:two-component system sensor histidine kinase TctE
MPAPLSLRRSLLLTIMVPLVLISVIGAALDYRLARETADSAFDFSLADAALDIATHVKNTETTPVVELASETEAMLRSNGPDTLFFSVTDAGGKQLFGDHDLRPAAAGTAEPLLDHAQFFDGRFRDHKVRFVVYQTASLHGPVTIAVAETIQKRLAASRSILAAMVVPWLAGLLAILLAVYFGVRRGLARLEQVEHEIASRSPRDLREINIGTAPNEVQPILARLNELFGMLRQAAAAQQRFLADAAHQLRTPLAGLQTQMDLAASEGRFEVESGRLARINQAIGRIGHLVDRLLTYARTEYTAQISHAFAPVALHDLVEQSASLFLDQALKKNIDLGFDLQLATVPGVAWMLREALANLIDNALRYTPVGGVVTVTCGTTPEASMLTVEDNGPGIPAAEMGQVFDRFYRVPGTSSDGCGLGLAIVKEIALLHGADLRLEETRGGGLRISMVFAH